MPDVQPLGSVRLPLPSSRRPARGRRRHRRLDARQPDLVGAVVGRLARRRFRNRPRSRPASTRSSGPARARSSRSSGPTTPGADATSAAFQGAIATTIAGLADDPDVTGIVGYAETGDPRFISTAGDAAYVVIELDVTDEESVDARRRDPRGDRRRRPATPTSSPATGRSPRTRPSSPRRTSRRPSSSRSRSPRSSSSSSSPRSSRPGCRCSSPAWRSRAAWPSSTSSRSRSR